MSGGTHPADAPSRIRRLAEEHQLVAVRLGGVDLDGIWRGKRIGIEEFLARTWHEGTGLCNALFAVTMADELFPGGSYTGWDRGFPEVRLVPDLTTCLQSSGRDTSLSPHGHSPSIWMSMRMRSGWSDLALSTPA